MGKVLLTGATGFVGNFLTHQLKDFRCVIRGRVPQDFNDYHKIERIDGFTNWDGAFRDIECVLHLAGLAHNKSVTDSQYHEVNYEGTIQLAREAVTSGVKRFVYVSSIGVNGCSTGNTPFTITSEPKAHNAYSQSKLHAEQGLKDISIETGLEVIIVRPTLVYGPNAPGNFGTLTRIVNKFPFLPFGLANNRRDFISVQNLVDLLIVCTEHPDAPGHTFLASDMETVSIKEFTNSIAKGLGKNLIQIPIPISFMHIVAGILGKSTMAEQLLGNLEVDSSNARDVLGWAPPYTMKQAMYSLSESKK
ncbi:NAD-dependent epimerase/dehydratase family protein [Shewanella sp. Isolate7]|uniref:NAD-dependent epimerase/dehydratase family protein n=1 Tax=Shewanella sp. Isolate7 TaxID=2908528 RepID=UPI001EFE7EC5|nr:NAD-dependent epimerase/dehydratase family protein [Shewanella sp. Isolate7]MCG9723359.1 NAD-dependent epimerase/dehydratase family protein [Shewanella sp. Isolate7]